MKLFTVGPVEPYPCTRNAYQQEIPYFRTAEYSALVQKCMCRLGQHIGLEEGGRIIYYAASGTGAMEATIDNLLSPDDDKALVINGGTFGARFCQLLSQHNIPHTVITIGTGETLTASHLAKQNQHTQQHPLHVKKTFHFQFVALFYKFLEYTTSASCRQYYLNNLCFLN